MNRDFQQVEWDAAAEEACLRLVRLAVAEDLERQQDWTTVSLVPAEATGSATMAARRAGIVAGLPAARVALAEIDSRVELREMATEGSSVASVAQLALLTEPARSLLTVERIVLNLVGRLSGIATLTRRYVDAVAGTNVRIYDTRKTMPGWRRLEKYAVRMGGGFNHRLGLFDAVLIKDNHLRLGAEAGRGAHFMPAEAVRRAKAFLNAAFPERPAPMIAEVEVDTLDQLREVLGERPDIVLLDNMSLGNLRLAVAIRDSVAPHVELEASGGVQLETVAQIARTGVDRISVGALTHSAAWLDVGLDWQ